MNEPIQQHPQPTSLMKQFEVLVGQWNMVGTHPALPAPARGHSAFEWLVAGGLLRWRFNWEPGGPPTALSVIGCDASVERCCLLYSDVRGISRIYQVSVEGGVWKMWRDAPGFSQRMTGEISSDGNTINWHGELSHDGSSWEQDLDITFTRKQ